MRPIDADALKEHMGIVDATKYGNKNAQQMHNSYGTLMCYEIADYIDDMPALDVQPVKRGEWVMVDEYCNHAKTYECTACRGAVELDRYTRCCDYDFCPNCGAKMEGR